MTKTRQLPRATTVTGSPKIGAPAAPIERRKAPRVSAADLPSFTAHLVDGPDIEIVNVSRTGVLTRSEARLMPGAMIGLQVLTAGESVLLFGRVVRSRLLSIDEGHVRYESALALLREFPLLAISAESSRAGSPRAEGQPARPPGSYPLEIGRLGGAPTVLTVTAFAEAPREEVLKAFNVDP